MALQVQWIKNKVQLARAPGTGTTKYDLWLAGRFTASGHHGYGMDQPHVLKEGWLHRLSQYKKKWAPRYFVLVAPGILFYFADEERANQFKALRVEPDLCSFDMKQTGQCRATQDNTAGSNVKFVAKDHKVGIKAADAFEKQALPLVMGSIRTFLVRSKSYSSEAFDNKESAHYAELKKLIFDDFQEAAKAWQSKGGEVKGRSNLLVVNGYQLSLNAYVSKENDRREVLLSAETPEEAQAWLTAAGDAWKWRSPQFFLTTHKAALDAVEEEKRPKTQEEFYRQAILGETVCYQGELYMKIPFGIALAGAKAMEHLDGLGSLIRYKGATFGKYGPKQYERLKLGGLSRQSKFHAVRNCYIEVGGEKVWVP